MVFWNCPELALSVPLHSTQPGRNNSWTNIFWKRGFACVPSRQVRKRAKYAEGEPSSEQIKQVKHPCTVVEPSETVDTPPATQRQFTPPPAMETVGTPLKRRKVESGGQWHCPVWPDTLSAALQAEPELSEQQTCPRDCSQSARGNSEYCLPPGFRDLFYQWLLTLGDERVVDQCGDSFVQLCPAMCPAEANSFNYQWENCIIYMNPPWKNYRKWVAKA